MAGENDQPGRDGQPQEGSGGRPKVEQAETTALPRAGAFDDAEPFSSDSILRTHRTAVPLGRERRAATSFLPGEMAGGRYRIIRFIAKGGMGEVYEAEDTELKKTVALKTIRPEIAKDESSLGLFKREIYLAHQITHPNVCRIFDIYHHIREWEDGARDDVVFLSMELLHGESLAERLRREGRLSTDTAVTLLRQMAAALAAAHKHGVVHRDFKSGNVMLVPDLTEAGGQRVVVADFGLARCDVSRDAFASVLQREEGMVVGTPAYMAPEQVEGGPITPAADIFALGVVFYEMLTGSLPFPGENALQVAVKRLAEPPVPPRQHLAEVEEKWEKVMMRCLERQPAERYASAMVLLEELDRMEKEVERRKLKRRIMIPAAALALVAVAVGGVLAYLGLRPPGGGSVAVLGFKNLSGRPEAAWLSTALSEMLGAEMAAGGQLRVVPGENVARMRAELGVESAEALAKDALVQVGKNLGTELVLVGSYLALGDTTGGKVRVVVTVQDAVKGRTLETFTANGTEEDLFSLIAETGSGLRAYLGLEKVTEEQRGTVRAAFPRNPEAARLYAQGLEKLRRFDANGAQQDLSAAVTAEPDHPLPHLYLSTAWQLLGYDRRMREEAKQAYELAGALPDRQRLEVEAAYYRAAGDRERELELFRKLWVEHPDDLEIGLRLAQDQERTGKGTEALETIAALRLLPEPAASDPRIDLYEASAAYSIGKPELQAEAAARAAAKGKARGASLVAAQAMLQRSSALNALGKPDEAVAAAEEARALFESAGDRGGVARSLVLMANVLNRRGDPSGAKGMYEEALAIHRQVGNQAGIATCLNNIASILHAQGDLAAAGATFEECLRVREETGDLRGVTETLINLGNNLKDRGELAAAAPRYEQALKIAGEIGDRRNQALALANSAELLLVVGVPAVAAERCEAAAKICTETGWKQPSAGILATWGEALWVLDDLEQARARLGEALAIGQEAKATVFVAASERGLAALALEASRLDEAQAGAARAVDLARGAGSPRDEALAELVLSQVLLTKGDRSAAREASQRGSALAQASQMLDTRLRAAVLAAALEQGASAREHLVVIAEEAAAAGLVVVALEARLELGRHEMLGGLRAAGRQRLVAVEKEATAAGLKLLARHAREARGV